jgi:hypothetical protein
LNSTVMLDYWKKKPKRKIYMTVESIESRARLTEMYLPVYSSNGWEMRQDNYNEKIRFIITLSPKILINLFNRKWF